jgi:hypothetical protein
MRILRFGMAVVLSLVAVASSSAQAPPHVADQAVLDRLVAAQLAQQEADRQLIRGVLQRQEVREVARRAGLDIGKAEAAVATLDGQDLKDAARRARQAQERLSGGSSSVTFSTTTIIIILLLVILIIVAVR